MTCCIGVRIPGRGAVLAADSRVTAGTEIISDRCDKLLRCGSVGLGVSGQDGGLVQALLGCSDLAGVLSAADKYTHGRSLSWQAMLYDTASDSLGYLDSDGCLLRSESWFVGVGSGAPWAMGWLSAHTAPRSVKVARRLAREAVRVACQRDSACGGAIRLVTLA